MVSTVVGIFGLLLLSASFSSLETALFSLTPVERRRLRQAGGLFSWILRARETPRELLMTVLMGNELVNVAISIMAGAFAYKIFEGSDLHWVFVISISVTTLVLLIFGEIIPKNIAVRNPVLISQVLILPYKVFHFLTAPFRIVLTRFADFLVGLSGLDPRKGRRMIVEEEFRRLIDMSGGEGGLGDLERGLIQNALDLSGVRVGDRMTSRTEIFALSADLPLGQVLKTLKGHRFSRIPVYRNSLNEILGFLHVKELIRWRSLPPPSRPPSVRELLKPVAVVGPHETLDRVFERFRVERVHMGVVRDPQGNVVGLITMDDLLRGFFS